MSVHNIIRKDVRLKTILVLLPANGTHPLQPLDVAVVIPFNVSVDSVMRGFNLRGGEGIIAR